MKMKSIFNGLRKKLYHYKIYYRYLGFQKRCPICGKFQKDFATYNNRSHAKCIWCGSLERHRLIWLFLTRKTDLLNRKPKKMLHFAPEACFVELFSKIYGEGYITADLYKQTKLKTDITDIELPDNYIDNILCSHVLEHVVDDQKAIREMARVLKKGGWAIILVPITVDETIEDNNITSPKERLEHYGQEDHVRRCGFDYQRRISDNGFIVEEFRASDITNQKERKYYGLINDVLYQCKI